MEMVDSWWGNNKEQILKLMNQDISTLKETMTVSTMPLIKEEGIFMKTEEEDVDKFIKDNSTLVGSSSRSPGTSAGVKPLHIKHLMTKMADMSFGDQPIKHVKQVRLS